MEGWACRLSLSCGYFAFDVYLIKGQDDGRRRYQADRRLGNFAWMAEESSGFSFGGYDSACLLSAASKAFQAAGETGIWSISFAWHFPESDLGKCNHWGLYVMVGNFIKMDVL